MSDPVFKMHKILYLPASVGDQSRGMTVPRPSGSLGCLLCLVIYVACCVRWLAWRNNPNRPVAPNELSSPVSNCDDIVKHARLMRSLVFSLFVATNFTLLIHLAGLYWSGNYPFNMNVAADCLEQWATGSWKKCPPLKVDWPRAQAYLK